MANVFEKPDMIAKEALMHVKNNCVMGNLVYRGYEKEWDNRPNGWHIGQTVDVKAPVYFRVKDGNTVDRVDLFEQTTPFTVNYHKHVAWAVSAEEMTLDIDQWSKRYLEPAMQAITNFIDTSLLGLYNGIPNQVGTPGTTPKDFITLALAGAKLTQHAAPLNDRHVVIEPIAQAYIANEIKGLFHPQMVGSAFERSKLPPIAGFETYVSQNVNTHTNGTAMSGLTIQKDGISIEEDTTLPIKSDGTNQTFKKGDIFTIAAVNGVNPISGISTGVLRQWVVDANATMDGAGEVAALQTTPGTAPYKIRASGAAEAKLPYQNVDVLPQANAVITPEGTTGQIYPVNLAFHRNCLGLAMVPLVIPASAHWKATMSHEGYTISVVRYFDGDTLTETIRFDVLFGLKVLNPFLGCRIAG